MAFKPKAETMFEEKVQYWINLGRWDMVEQVTLQFEAWQKLIEPLCSYEKVHTDEVGDIDVCKVHGENSKHNAVAGEHRPCLKLDPWPLGLDPNEQPSRLFAIPQEA